MACLEKSLAAAQFPRTLLPVSPDEVAHLFGRLFYGALFGPQRYDVQEAFDRASVMVSIRAENGNPEGQEGPFVLLPRGEKKRQRYEERSTVKDCCCTVLSQFLNNGYEANTPVFGCAFSSRSSVRAHLWVVNGAQRLCVSNDVPYKLPLCSSFFGGWVLPRVVLSDTVLFMGIFLRSRFVFAPQDSWCRAGACVHTLDGLTWFGLFLTLQMLASWGRRGEGDDRRSIFCIRA